MSKCWMFTPLAQNGRGCLTSNFSMIGMFAGKRQFQTSWKRTTSWCHSLHSFWGIALLLKSKRQWVRMGHLVINWVCKTRLDLFSLILLGPFLYLFFGEAQLKQFHQFNQWCWPSSGWQLWFWMLRFGQTESCPKHYSFCFPPQNKYYINMEGSTQKHICKGQVSIDEGVQLCQAVCSGNKCTVAFFLLPQLHSSTQKNTVTAHKRLLEDKINQWFGCSFISELFLICFVPG